VHTADFANGPAIKAMVAATIGHFGRLDILINNAGGIVGSGAAIHAVTHEDAPFEQTLFLNLTSAYTATRAALPQMVKQDYGRIIFIGSGSAKRGGGTIAYTAAKHGLVGLTRAMAHQLPATITVNTLSPGWTNTSLVDFAGLAARWGIDVDAARARVEGMNVQNRVLEPEELGPMAVLLASEEGRGVTGQEISVDGGYKV